MDKFVALFLSVVALSLTIMVVVITVEIQSTNRTFVKEGFSKQYDSNVSGWIKP